MGKKVKSLHDLNWMYVNICTKKCCHNSEKQKTCYDRMKEIIKGHEDYLIECRVFIKVMREKHKTCSLPDAEFYQQERSFWNNHDCPICRKLGL